jgi:hypothetical protein
MYGVITNKQKAFVIYEWIKQFCEVALLNVSCHLVGIQYDTII